MFGNARNGIVKIGDTEMHYAAFGTGPKALVLLADGQSHINVSTPLLSVPIKGGQTTFYPILTLKQC